MGERDYNSVALVAKLRKYVNYKGLDVQSNQGLHCSLAGNMADTVEYGGEKRGLDLTSQKCRLFLLFTIHVHVYILKPIYTYSSIYIYFCFQVITFAEYLT